MNLSNKPKKIENKKYSLSLAKLKGYEYSKLYYAMKNGKPTLLDKSDDSSLTIISIRNMQNKYKENYDKKAFIVSEGYVGAEKSYHNNGAKRNSATRKYGFGIQYLIKYIENSKQNINDFYVVFMSTTEKSEIQADLFAQFIKDTAAEDNISSINMWCHSKSGLLSLRTFQKLEEENSEISKKATSKIRAVLTSMPVKGIRDTDRNDFIHRINENKLLNFIPLSGYIKTGIVSVYDKFLYKNCPAQIDIKANKNYEQEKYPTKIENKKPISKIIDIIQGNNIYNKYIQKDKKIDYDENYLTRVMEDKNIERINNIKYTTLPVSLDAETALKSLYKEGQIMPMILYLKKLVLEKGEKGDGIISYDVQGVEDMRDKLKVSDTKSLKSSHDIPATKDNLIKIGEELTRED